MSKEFDALLEAFGKARDDLRHEEFSRPRGCEDYFSRYLRDRAEAAEQALRHYVEKLELERGATVQFARDTLADAAKRAGWREAGGE